MRRDAIIKGHMPQPGEFVVHHGRRRAYGPIVSVRPDVVLLEGPCGSRAPTDHETLHSGGYEYSPTIPDGYARPDGFGGFTC